MMENYKPGTLRYQDSEGEWVTCSPGEPLYSTVTMIATEYWAKGQWRPLFEDDGEGSSND